MTRRTLTLCVAGALLLVTVLAVVMLPQPFVVKRPGATENTLGTCPAPGGRSLPILQIRGARTYPTTGHLQLTSVLVNSPQWQFGSRVPEVIKAWLSDGELVEPRAVEYPPTVTAKQAEQQSAQQMTGSQDSASTAALLLLGRATARTTVQAVERGAPAAGHLRAGDVLRAVDGTPVRGIQQAVDLISQRPVGSRVRVTVQRDGRELTQTLTTVANPDDPRTARIGISVGATVDSPVDVSYRLCEDIGGPSAGLMFALGIYDRLTPGNLTGGRFVAGTGEISPAGAVGPIGGIQEKMIAVRDLGATVFLSPADNCSEAATSPVASELQVVRVETLRDAVRALDDIREGRADQVPSCTTSGGQR